MEGKKEFITIAEEMYMFKRARFGNPKGHESMSKVGGETSYIPEELIFEGEDGQEVSLHIDHPLLQDGR